MFTFKRQAEKGQTVKRMSSRDTCSFYEYADALLEKYSHRVKSIFGVQAQKEFRDLVMSWADDIPLCSSDLDDALSLLSERTEIFFLSKLEDKVRPRTFIPQPDWFSEKVFSDSDEVFDLFDLDDALTPSENSLFKLHTYTEPKYTVYEINTMADMLSLSDSDKARLYRYAGYDNVVAYISRAV